MDAMRTLRERLRWNRSVCLALERAGEDLGDWRVGAAKRDLSTWLGDYYPAEIGTRRPSGLDEMGVPPGCAGLLPDLYAVVAERDSMGVYYTADAFAQMDLDAVEVRTCLAEWCAVADDTAGSEAGARP